MVADLKVPGIPGGMALMTFLALGAGVASWWIFFTFFPGPVNSFLGVTRAV